MIIWMWGSGGGGGRRRGPTAAGKSELNLDLLGAGHPRRGVNADSEQLYRGMDIGTAKLRPLRARGYQQVLRYLAGDRTQEQAKVDTIQATRRFVRRQRSWFRRDARSIWLAAAAADAADRAARLMSRPVDEQAG
jgi:tRNA A37 N6-isopentenylltransferase MiaA